MSPYVNSAPRDRKRRAGRVPLLAFFFAFIQVGFAPGTGWADSGNDLRRWAPALAIQSGMVSQTGSGNLQTSEVYGARGPLFEYTGPPECPLANQTCPAVFPTPQNDFLLRNAGIEVSGEERMMTPYFSVAAELMSPDFSSFCPFCSHIANPRAVVHADVGYAFAQDRPVARSGTPADIMTLPTPPPLLPADESYNEATISGQGARISARTGSLIVAAGAGLAFTFNSGERTFRIKPTFEYLREELRIKATLRHATQVSLQSPPHDESSFPASPEIPLSDDATPGDAGFREIRFDAGRTRILHGIGPGLELEMDTGRAGSFLVSVYGGARAYRFMGDMGVDFYTENSPNADEFLPLGQTNVEERTENDQRNCTLNDPTQCENASFHFEKERWAYTGHVGIRFRWSPE